MADLFFNRYLICEYKNGFWPTSCTKIENPPPGFFDFSIFTIIYPMIFTQSFN
ncbi:MAG: hypothetical protein ACI9XO_000984 [Paraglaciecola sp.]|jgi:hypothetical protein